MPQALVAPLKPTSPPDDADQDPDDPRLGERAELGPRVVVAEDEAVALAVLGVAVGAVLAHPDPVAEAVPVDHPGDARLRPCAGQRGGGEKSRAARRSRIISGNRFGTSGVAACKLTGHLVWKKRPREEIAHGDADSRGNRSQAPRRRRVDRDRRVGRGAEPLRRQRRRPGRRRATPRSSTAPCEAAHEAFEAADFPQHERAEVLDRAAELVGERIDELALTIAAEAGKPIKTATVEAERCVDTLTFSAVEARKLTGGTVPMEASAGRRRQARGDAAGPLRGRRRDQPLQLPAQPRRPQARAGDRRRQRGRPQAGRPDADLGAEAGRRSWSRRGCRRAGSASSPGPGSEVGNAIVEHELTRGDHLHRLGRGRLGDPQQRPAQEGQPRARLQRAADRPRRRRLGDGGRQGQAPRLLPRRPELHLDPADPRPRGRRRRLHRAARRQRREAARSATRSTPRPTSAR